MRRLRNRLKRLNRNYRNNKLFTNKLISMKKVTKVIGEYNSPQLSTLELVSEQCIAGSSGSLLDDMWESDGKWDDVLN